MNARYTLPEKVSLIGDISALTGNGKIPLGKALALAPALARDRDARWSPRPWRSLRA